MMRCASSNCERIKAWRASRAASSAVFGAAAGAPRSRSASSDTVAGLAAARRRAAISLKVSSREISAVAATDAHHREIASVRIAGRRTTADLDAQQAHLTLSGLEQEFAEMRSTDARHVDRVAGMGKRNAVRNDELLHQRAADRLPRARILDHIEQCCRRKTEPRGVVVHVSVQSRLKIAKHRRAT